MDGDLAYCESGKHRLIGPLDLEAGREEGWEYPAIRLINKHPFNRLMRYWNLPHSYHQYKILIHIPER